MTRTCYVCNISKPIESFYKKRSEPSGYRFDCKECAIKRASKWNKDNNDKIKAKKKTVDGRAKQYEYYVSWREKNPGKAKESWDSYYAVNKNKYAEKRKKDAERLDSRYRSLVNSSRRGTRNIEVDLSLDDYAALVTNAQCHYCQGTLPKRGSGLDRKDNLEGYTKENCVPCCTECNRVKSCYLSYSEMLAVAALLKELRK